MRDKTKAPLLLGTELREFKRFVPLAFGGHCYYVRQCTRGQLDDEGRPVVGNLFLPDHHKNYTSQVEVLVVGPMVGQYRDKTHRAKYGGATYIASDVQPGDILMCPNEHAGIKESRLGNAEYFIEENTPYYKIEVEQENANAVTG